MTGKLADLTKNEPVDQLGILIFLPQEEFFASSFKSGVMTTDPNILYQIEARLIEVLDVAKSSGDGFLTHLISVALLDAREKLGNNSPGATRWNAQIYDLTSERLSRQRPERANNEAFEVSVDTSPKT